MALNKEDVAKYSGVERCAVCLDQASGFHYSVLSCEGCKGISFNKNEKTKFQLAFQDSSVARCRKEPSMSVTKKVDARSIE